MHTGSSYFTRAFTALGLIFSFFFGAARYAFVPTVIFDCAAPGAAVTSNASGVLYGLAEEGVPDPLMAQSIDLSAAAQKVIGGLQHPIGDVDHVAANLDSAEDIVVYLQDAYDTWYYDILNIAGAREAGTWDWRAFLQEDYFPKVTAAVEALREKPYADRLVYCLYNECDNGVWFGTSDAHGNGIFDDDGNAAFLEAWKLTYDLVRSLHPQARIGGPGYCDFNQYNIARFLVFCEENACLPDVMIWHELGLLSSEEMDLHLKNYRTIEEAADVSPLPVLITEYGAMRECGNPALLFRYVRQFEETGMRGCLAYWRLANNLCDTCADGVSPNACWWLYRWYADMEGTLLQKEVRDLFHADFGKAVKEVRQLRYKHLNGFGALSPEKNRIDILLGGADYPARVRLTGLKDCAFGRLLSVKVEQVAFEGLGGRVFAPTPVAEYTARAPFGSLKIKLDEMDLNAVYHIVVTPAAEETAAYKNTGLPQRFEFELGERLGTAYTYESNYASTGEICGLVGGIEYPGDGVRLLFTVPETGDYDLSLIYGKANDGDSPEDRVSAVANYTLDGEKGVAVLPNTIRSEYTSKLTRTVYLERGDHELVFTHGKGTFVLDSLIVTPARRTQEIAVLREPESDGEGPAYIAIAPETGYYRVETEAAAFTVNGLSGQGSAVYLRQGLNLIRLSGAGGCRVTKDTSREPVCGLQSAGFTLSGGAKLKNDALTGLTSSGGSASFTVEAPETGDYCVTLVYSNNAEGGLHDYNVDLIERYFTVSAGETVQRVWCRNTCSDENRAEVTFGVRLQQGKNEITLSNDGSVRFSGFETEAPRLYEARVFAAFAE